MSIIATGIMHHYSFLLLKITIILSFLSYAQYITVLKLSEFGVHNFLHPQNCHGEIALKQSGVSLE